MNQALSTVALITQTLIKYNKNGNIMKVHLSVILSKDLASFCWLIINIMRVIFLMIEYTDKVDLLIFMEK